jgi:rare lipoprotein A
MRRWGKFRTIALIAAGLAMASALSGCSSQSSKQQDPFAGTGSPRFTGKGPIPKGGGRYVVGQPYEVAGRMFYPKEDSNYDKVGLASWYGPQFHKRMTSNGEWFDMNYMSAAHATLPIPSYARVTNLENGRQIVVRINDRGPFVGTRIIDLSRRSAEALSFKEKGMAKVRVQYLGPAPLGDDSQKLARLNRGVPLETQVASVSRPMEPEPKPVASTVLAANNGGFFVQVGAFADPGNAERARTELSDAGPVEIVPIDDAAGTLYRVRIGPLGNERAAENALQRAIETGHSDARMVMAQANL